MLMNRVIPTAVVVEVVALLATCQGTVRTGLDRVAVHSELFRGKRIGVVTNHTAYDSGGKYIVDVFRAMPGVTVAALFSPEHGLWGTEEAGVKTEGRLGRVLAEGVNSCIGRSKASKPKSYPESE